MTSDIFYKILDWSEVWALFIPLAAWFYNRSQPTFLKPVIVYLWLALFINVAIDVIVDHNVRTEESETISNNPLYNLHSVVRFFCFFYFFLFLRQPYFKYWKRTLFITFCLFLVVNFTLFEDFFFFRYFSGNLLSIEAYFLLIYCVLYYLNELKVEVSGLMNEKAFWVVTGLCLYVAINFFVFLFYIPLNQAAEKNNDKQLWAFVTNIWNIHNVAFIILCIFIAKALYVSKPISHNN